MLRRVANPADAGVERHRRRRATDHGAGPEADEPGSALGIPGLSEDALTPELREGLARLAAERNRLRDELAKARGRIASLERLADEDPLTSVANRRAFVRQLTRMIAFTHRYGVPASVVYFDLNNMKHINDEHGHPTGDAALRHMATVLRGNIRSSDIVGRLGGDEFGVILAQTDEEQAHGIPRRVRPRSAGGAGLVYASGQGQAAELRSIASSRSARVDLRRRPGAAVPGGRPSVAGLVRRRVGDAARVDGTAVRHGGSRRRHANRARADHVDRDAVLHRRCGPSKSGRSTILLSMALSFLASGTRLILVTPRPSPLRSLASTPGVVRLFEGSDLDEEQFTAALESFDL